MDYFATSFPVAGQMAIRAYFGGLSLCRKQMLGSFTNRAYRTIVLVWISLSVASVILSAVTWTQLRERLRTSADAAALRDLVDTVYQSLLEAQNGERGFTLSGLEIFVLPFQRAETRLPDYFQRLVELAGPDTNLVSLILELRGRVEVMTARHHRIIEVRRGGGERAAEELIETGEGEALMNGVRLCVEKLRGARLEASSSHVSASHRQLQRAELTSLSMGILGMGAGFFAFHFASLAARHQRRERELLEAKVQAEHDSREKSSFLANMSHEIRTPMNAILGFSELLASDVKGPKQREYLNSIRTSASSLLQLINDILDMSKVEAGVLELRPEPADPREICDFLLTLFSGPAARKGLKLTCKVAEDLPKALLLDRSRLRQVLVNLVGNAVKFTDTGGVQIEIACQRETGSQVTLLVAVEDTGVGIPADRLEAVFEPFVQSGADRTKEEGGTGLGLTIVKRLVQLMGGEITLTSVVNRGTTFRLQFPGVPISVRLAQATAEIPSHLTDFNILKPSTILVVDDNAANCRLVAGMFDGSHHELLFGDDGREAVAKARTFHPDLILLDIRMPHMDGHQVLTAVRTTPGLELLPVVAMTASSPHAGSEACPYSFDGYLRKPFSRRELLHELSQLLPTVEFTPPATPPGRTVPACTDQTRALWEEAAVELRRIEAADFRVVSESLAINESRAFAGRIEALGHRFECEPLVTYGEAVRHFADAYAVVELERQLKQFPSLIATVQACVDARRMEGTPA